MKTDDWSRYLTTRTGLTFHVRPISPRRSGTGESSGTTPEDLRFRFLGGVREVSHERLVAMRRIDHRQTENFLAFAEDGRLIIATAMLACDKVLRREGWRSPSCRLQAQRRGLGAASPYRRYAEAKGVKTLERIE